MSEPGITDEDQEETVAEFGDDLSDEALDRGEMPFCTCRSSFIG
jgi:hypothetical protein